MTEHLGHKLGARADRELQRGVRVAEIMEPDLRQAGKPRLFFQLALPVIAFVSELR